jgi:FkbM family methyltransferase
MRAQDVICLCRICDGEPRERKAMLEIEQFKKKVNTHGLLLALAYSAEYAARPLWRRLWVEPVLKSYSQRYEDRIIDDILGNKAEGTYLDIGAYDPRSLSNTRRFYDRGWKGCNVEPNPRRFEKFLNERPRDINLNLGLSSFAGKLIFFDAEQEEFSTFSQERADELKRMGARIRREIEVPVITMKDLFAEHFESKAVDFCSIDTEGMDLEILRGNDWQKFRPRVICVEVSLVEDRGKDGQAGESVESFLARVGYRKHSETVEFGVPLNQIYVSET